MNPKYEGLEVVEVKIHADGKGFTASWCAPLIGFGNLVVFLDGDGKIHVDTERMSDEFVSLVLSKLVGFMVVEG